MKKNILTRTVWVLALVSLFADFASEMLYPIMPVYLKSIGFSMVLIGVLEGLAEAVAGLGKGYFGKMSDHFGVRVPFVRWGYLASAVAKPLLAASTSVFWVFGVRTLDRIGKGLRTGARDAMLSAESAPETKAQIFGFHRSMDTFGAVLGPSVALVYLYFYPENYKTLFLLAFLPGVFYIFLTFILKENATKPAGKKPRPALFSFLNYWKDSPAAYRKLCIGLLAFTFFNSSDVFLLLKMKTAGQSDSMVIGAYIFYNLVFALSAYPIGIAADKLGIKKVYLLGLLLFSMTYFLFAFTENRAVFFAAFVFYGWYAACTEGIAKAWISNICKKEDTATAIGTFTGLQSLAALLASVFAGMVWQFFGAGVPFVLSGIGAILVAIYLKKLT